MDAFFGAESDGDDVVVTGIVVEQFFFEDALTAFHSFDILADVGDVPTAAADVIRMGSGTKADIRRAVPIAGVMAGAEAGTGEVGDFIVLIACGLQTVDEGVVHMALGLFINTLGTVPIVLFQHPMQRGALFDGQTVGGDVFDVEGEGGVDVGLPVGKGFAREAVHESRKS